MSKWRKKPVVIEATQWPQDGEHPAVQHVDARSTNSCNHCGRPMSVHGWLSTLEGGHIACPGDWIITGIKGEHYPCKPDVFDATYEPEQGEEKGNG